MRLARAAALLAFALGIAGGAAFAFQASAHAQPAGSTRNDGAQSRDSAEDARDSITGAQLDLGALECRALFEHQLKLLRADPDNPLYAALRENRAALASQATRTAEIQHCLQTVSRDSFICQMDAKRALGLFECQAKHGLHDAQKITDADGSDDGAANDNGGDGEASGENGRGPVTETLPGGSLRVDANSCRSAYRKIYDIMTASDSFAGRTDREQLREYWQSEEARESFQERCVERFRPEDLGCIMRAGDADVIQGCLLVIPDEE